MAGLFPAISVFQAGKNTSSRSDAGKLASGQLKYGGPEQSLLNRTDRHRFNRQIKTLFILSYLFTYLCFEWEGFFQSGMTDRKRRGDRELGERTVNEPVLFIWFGAVKNHPPYH